MQVRNVMSSPAVSVGPDVTVAAAASLLAEHRFTALPVVEDGELVGIVTEIDLLHGRVRHDARPPLPAAELAMGAVPQTVADVMAVDVLIAAPTTDVADVVEAMRTRRVRSVPVVTGGVRGRELIGVVTRRDILAAIARDDGQLAHDVCNRLARHALPGRWHVDVHDGIVTLGDPFDDETGRQIAALLAGSVRGVIGVRIAAVQL
ncbi:CBS domain protein [Pseudonocardia hierapolitana]|uniref:CBS domain protein n=1 Tax=Pseudonocardia hierapolitana TaxID=1128676 RepID=A0A561SJW1_9PSEU|nr:CBS domain-containing protein [Pseudonocardia hierapolitana]TWF75141.1 CBS domain protein [Pseudonocardia hierapolitana]